MCNIFINRKWEVGQKYGQIVCLLPGNVANPLGLLESLLKESGIWLSDGTGSEMTRLFRPNTNKPGQIRSISNQILCPNIPTIYAHCSLQNTLHNSGWKWIFDMFSNYNFQRFRLERLDVVH